MLPAWCSHSCSENSNRAMQSDATRTRSLFYFIEMHHSQGKSSAVCSSHHPAGKPVAAGSCLRLSLSDFQIFSTHSQYSRSQGFLLATENKSPEYLCLTQFSRSHRINDAFSLNLVSGVYPSIPVSLVPGVGEFMNLGPSSTQVS